MADKMENTAENSENPQSRESDFQILRDAASFAAQLIINDEYKPLRQFLQSVAVEGGTIISENPDYVGALVYVTTVVAVSWHFTKDSSKKLKASALMQEEDFEMLEDSEFTRMLNFLKDILKNKEEDKILLLSRIDDDFKTELKNAIESMKVLRKKMNEEIITIASEKAANDLFLKLSCAVLITGLGVAIGNAYSSSTITAMFDSPPLTAVTAISGIGAYMSWKHDLAFNEAMEVLNRTRKKALTIEKGLRSARTQITIAKTQNILNNVDKTANLLKEFMSQEPSQELFERYKETE